MNIQTFYLNNNEEDIVVFLPFFDQLIPHVSEVMKMIKFNDALNEGSRCESNM